MNKRKTELELQLKKLNDREKQLKAQMRAIDAREKEAERKKETRAKIILGGFFVSQLKNGEQMYSEFFDKAIDKATERERGLLVEYKKKVFQF